MPWLEHAVFVFSTLHSQHHRCKFKFVIWISVACFKVRQRSSATYSNIWDTVYVIRCIKSHLHGKNYYVMTGASPCDSFTEIREQKVSMIHRKKWAAYSTSEKSKITKVQKGNSMLRKKIHCNVILSTCINTRLDTTFIQTNTFYIQTSEISVTLVQWTSLINKSFFALMYMHVYIQMPLFSLCLLIL